MSETRPYRVPCPSCGAPSLPVAAFASPPRTAWRCPRCGLRSLRPLPGEEELAAFYGRDGYFSEDLGELHGALVAGYDDGASIVRLYRRHLDVLGRSVPPPASLFEIGCARGVLLDLARRRGYRASGIERNPAAAAYARERFGLDVECAALERSRTERAPFDAVICLDTLEHVPDPAAFVGHAAHILRPGGHLLVGTPDAASVPYRLAETAARMTGGRWSYPLWRFYGRGYEHLHLFTFRALSALLRGAGLEVVGVHRYAIPVDRLCAMGTFYRLAMRALMPWPYEIAVIARKQGTKKAPT